MGVRMEHSKRETQTRFLLGALLGLAVFLLLYGFGPLNVTNDAFLRGGYVEQDIQQHYAGWLFYRQSPLGLPLCFTQRINWPAGLSVAFTDSIPLFAALFRLLSPLLPSTFQYFGIYTLLCFMLQGGFGALLAGLFTRRTLPALLGAVPFVVSPILLERAFRHTSLAAHFLILGALYYYLLGRRQNRFAYKGLFALNCLAFALHPYFVPMTYALTFALLAEHAVHSRRPAKPLLYLAGNLAATLAVGWLFGLFQGGSSSGGSGISYGHFCMNLNALWNPSSLGLRWSLLLPVQNQVLGNYDGFNYLGLGVLLGCLGVGLWALARRKTVHPLLWCRRHFCLLLVCLCLTGFAVSNVITANGAVLLRLPLPQLVTELATTFRSSGRLFWPVYYLLTLFCVAGLARMFRSVKGRDLSAAALAVLCAVQLLDLSPALAAKAASLRQYEPAVADTVTGTTPALCETSSFFETAAGRYSHLIALDPLKQTGLRLALYAADAGMTSTDTSFAARYDEAAATAAAQKYRSAILRGELPAGCLFVTEREETFLALADAARQAGAWCGLLSFRDAGGAHPAIYVIAPGLGDSFSSPLATAYSEAFPFHLADYSDDHWSAGILSLNLEAIGRQEDENKVVLFYDTPFLRRKLAGAKALRAGGEDYPILNVSDADEGWLMVTLDTQDARALAGKSLEAVS